ncbi:unnamed protein product [Brassica rapa subsp. trilocularis]
MDRLTQLPDDLLIKILSFVPTKGVVATSILSKRWLPLWTLVPSLVFEDFSEEEDDEINEIHVRSLSQFVSGTLLLHKATVLERFHLYSASECSAWEIGLWVRIAVDRFVRDLKISFCYDHFLVNLPSRLFRCETLETLQLRRVILSEVPCRLSFPSLTKLRLLSVKYSDDESFSRLVSNCPILEDLVVETCHGDNVATFTVNLPSLQSLSVRNTVRESPPDDHLFVIHSQSLKQLNIVDYFGELELIGNLPKLVEANLQSMSFHTNVLESFTFVRRLYVCLDGEKHWILVDRKVRWMQPRRVPECLLLHLKTFEWSDYEGTKVEKEVAIYILKNAKLLVSATIYPFSVSMVRKHQMFKELEIATRSLRALNTSILSKRKSLWRMMQVLEYDANSRPKISSCTFENFFRRSLKLHEAPVLQTLTLKLREQHSSSLKFPSSFPNTVFRKLVVLKLHTIQCHGFTDESPVCFRSMKSLHLTKRLEIKDYTSVRTYPSNKSRFKINAPSLKYLEVYINGSNFEFYKDLHNLVEASLLVDDSQTDKLLRFLTSVEFLSIHLYPTKVVLLLADTISQRLRHLKLSTYGKNSRNLLLYLLKHCPKLQVLKLQEIHWTTKWPGSPHTRCKDEEFKDPPPLFCKPSSVPECLSFNLKTFGWKCYKGKEEEKEIVLYILQNAPCLKTTKISVYSPGHRFREKELLRIKELESVPKASTSCQLVIRLTNSS